MCISMLAKCSLKPEISQVQSQEPSHQAATFTNGEWGPTLIANIEYPVLCQSMMSFVPIARAMICARRRVGMEGGF